MRYLVRVNELKQRVEYIADCIKIIEENIEVLNKAKDTIIWEGDASIRFKSVYNNYLAELNKLKNDIVLINKFLTSYYDRYGSAYTSLRNKYNNGRGI